MVNFRPRNRAQKTPKRCSIRSKVSASGGGPSDEVLHREGCEEPVRTAARPSPRPREGQRVAAALQALRRKEWPSANGVSARRFIEERAGDFHILYRFDRDRIKVALLARMTDWHARETPHLDLGRDADD
jgi:hypothetical protein